MDELDDGAVAPLETTHGKKNLTQDAQNKENTHHNFEKKEGQIDLRALPRTALIDIVLHYLNACENPQLVSADEEHFIFPVLIERLKELHVGELLEIVQVPYARSTLLRYGLALKDLIRDRIAQITSAAARQQHLAASTTSAEKTEDSAPPTDGEGAAVLLYTFEKEDADRLRTEDPILADALTEMSAEQVIRCIIVMGFDAGRRKRDLEFFTALGSFLVFFINTYKNPSDLVRVLSALSRAKIIPPKSFLALLARRLPVLHKKNPLEPLMCYRAMVNFARMGHDQITVYRFLADVMFARMEQNLAAERLAVGGGGLSPAFKAPGVATATPPEGVTATPPEGVTVTPPEGVTATPLEGVTVTPPEGVTATPPRAATATSSKTIKATSAAAPSPLSARARLTLLSGLTPACFTRWLAILAQLGAPHQPYLRPLLRPLVVPALTGLPPPSFSRLLHAARRFRAGDAVLVEGVVALLSRTGKKGGGPRPADLIALLSLLSVTDGAVPENFDELARLCRDGLSPPEENESNREDENEEEKEKHEEKGKGGVFLRPKEMCDVAMAVYVLGRRTDLELAALAPLEGLMESFARRMTVMMNFGLAPLPAVDAFAELCTAQLHPDPSGSIARMVDKRRQISQQTGEAASSSLSSGSQGNLTIIAGEELYESAIDIDVREVIRGICAVNESNTYGGYRPLPGPLQVDFRELLAKSSAMDILVALDIFEQAFPKSLKISTGRFLTRSLLAKFSGEGEEVIAAEHTLEIRKVSPELLLTREGLLQLAQLVRRTPLKKVRRSEKVWSFILTKAKNLGMEDVEAVKFKQFEKKDKEVGEGVMSNAKATAVSIEAHG
ncbi:unnamed protein product [Phytomonas sp. Hart1]|nr:unnamed protein product [Phytomonas sp. Hart1]|eukprot:CCW71972.1 unnamed protein product [Phytomonas sp. isolate Hart1]